MPFIADTFHLGPKIVAYSMGGGGKGFAPFNGSEDELPAGWKIYFRDDGKVFDTYLLKYGMDGWRAVDPDDLRKWIAVALNASPNERRETPAFP